MRETRWVANLLSLGKTKGRNLYYGQRDQLDFNGALVHGLRVVRPTHTFPVARATRFYYPTVQHDPSYEGAGNIQVAKLIQL